MDTRECNKSHIVKSVTEYYKDNSRKCGTMLHCKLCLHERLKAARSKNATDKLLSKLEREFKKISIANPGYYVISKDLEMYNINSERLSNLDEDLLAGNFGFNKLTEHGEIFINNTRVIFSDKFLHLLGMPVFVRYCKLALLELLINPVVILYPDDENLISSIEDQSRYRYIASYKI